MTLNYDQFFTESKIKDIDNKIKIDNIKNIVSQVDQNDICENHNEK
ncbi:hypothetical protein [Candidatus Tisiphia endosymbiont of Nemotelus uliginosus]